MSLATQLLDAFEAESRRHAVKHRLHVKIASTADEIEAALRLRHEVFVEEMGARVDCAVPGIERDRFDDYCQHLIAQDTQTGEVIGCYRLLSDSDAQRAGGFYSESEFDLARVLALPGRFVEVGRTCVQRDHRNGTVMNLLWSGLARYMLIQRMDYLMGCASLPLNQGMAQVAAIYQAVATEAMAPTEWRVQSRLPLPDLGRHTDIAPADAAVPPLVRAYLRLGAKVCGEPAWDPDFNVADIFLLLNIEHLSQRYARHFLRQR